LSQIADFVIAKMQMLNVDYRYFTYLLFNFWLVKNITIVIADDEVVYIRVKTN